MKHNLQLAWYKNLNWFEVRGGNCDVFCWHEDEWSQCRLLYKAKSWFYVQLKRGATKVLLQGEEYELDENLQVDFDRKALHLHTMDGVKYLSRLQSDRRDGWILLKHEESTFGASFDCHRLSQLWRYCRIQPMKKHCLGPAYTFWLPPIECFKIQICMEMRGSKHIFSVGHNMVGVSASLIYVRQSQLSAYPEERCCLEVDAFPAEVDLAHCLAGDRFLFQAPKGAILEFVQNGNVERGESFVVEKKPSHFRRPWQRADSLYRACEPLLYCLIAGFEHSSWADFSIRYPWLSTTLQNKNFRFFRKLPLNERLMECSPELLHCLEVADV